MTDEQGKEEDGRRRRVGRVEEEVVNALIVNNVQKVLGWTGAAASALGFAVFKFLYDQLSVAALIAAGLALVFLVPPLVGATRSRILRRAKKAESENRKLRTENEGLKAAKAQAVRSSEVLADWLKNTLVNPYEPRSSDPDRDFEGWLNHIVMKVMRVVFPEQGTVALAVVSERGGNYCITHCSAGIPDAILRVDPAPIHRPLEECINRHTPGARAFSFLPGPSGGWVAFFPERPFEEDIHRSQLASIAATVANVYGMRGLGVGAAS
jgi:hypothetical protein